MFGIAANLIRGHWRTEERRLRALAREGGRVASPIDPLLHVDDAVDASAELDRVLLAVAALSPEDRDLLTLFAWEECGYAEIAEALEIPVGTVRCRVGGWSRRRGFGAAQQRPDNRACDDLRDRGNVEYIPAGNHDVDDSRGRGLA